MLTTNRFLSADSIIPDPANPQSFNRYSYVYNNPINSIDPTGHCALDDQACWDYLNDDFCNGLDCGELGWRDWISMSGNSDWTKNDLSLIKEGLLSIKISLNFLGIEDWNSFHTNPVFEKFRGRGDKGATFDARPGQNIIHIGRGVLEADADDLVKIFIIIHEMAHSIDTQFTGMADGDRSNSLGNNLENYPDGSQNCFRRYACGQIRERWADAYAIYALNSAGPHKRSMSQLINEDLSQLVTGTGGYNWFGKENWRHMSNHEVNIMTTDVANVISAQNR